MLTLTDSYNRRALPMNLTALPAFSDNPIWMWGDGARALVVDPGDAAPFETALEARSLELPGILVTHQPADHGDGADVLRRWKDPFR